MNGATHLHRVMSISATHMELKDCGGTGCTTIEVTTDDGSSFSLNLFSKQPIAIEGAELLALMAQPAEPMVVDGGTFSDERREYFL